MVKDRLLLQKPGYLGHCSVMDINRDGRGLYLIELDILCDKE